MSSWLGSLASGLYQRVASALDREEAPDLKSAFANGDVPIDPYDDQDPATFRAAYKEMMFDAAVSSALYTKVFEVCALNLKVQGDDPEVAAFVEYALRNLRGGTRRLLTNMTVPALKWQFSICEVNYKLAERGKYAGKYVLESVKSKDVSGDDWSFHMDEFKNVIGLVQSAVKGQLEHDPQKFLHYRFCPDFENPRGQSDLKKAYRFWWIKKTVLRAWSVFGAKMGPMVVAHYENPADKPALETQAAAASARRWAVVPANVQVEVLDFAKGGSGNYETILNYLDKQIYLGVRNAYLQALEGSLTGARNMGEIHQDTAKLFSWYLSEDLADTLNEQLVPKLVDLNFAGADYPKVKLEIAEQKDVVKRAEVLAKAKELGLEVSKKQAYEDLGLVKPEDEDDTLGDNPMDFLEDDVGQGAGGPGKADGPAAAQAADKASAAATA